MEILSGIYFQNPIEIYFTSSSCTPSYDSKAVAFFLSKQAMI